MSEWSGLLWSILERPDDDTPRLVAADWLDEHDQPERAMFIRIQCKLAACGKYEPYFQSERLRAKEVLGPEWEKEWDALKYRETMFIQEYGWDKLDPEWAVMSGLSCSNGWMPHEVDITRTRGFTCGISCPCEWFLENAQRLFNLCPIEKVTLSYVEAYIVRPGFLPAWLHYAAFIMDAYNKDDRECIISRACVREGRKLANLLAPAETRG